MSAVTLVFPSSMTASLSFSQKAKERGERIVAASSVKADETAKFYDQWVFLPSIYDADFPHRLVEIVTQHKVTRFYTPHHLVHTVVQKIIHEHKLAVDIGGETPVDSLNRHYQQVMTRAEEAQAFIRAIEPQNTLPLLSMASLFHHAEAIYGQTSETKIAAMAAAFHSAPEGDVIEIGSAWGRSAFVLLFLARHHAVGKVLCVDPWTGDIATQNESSDTLEDLNKLLDWEMMCRIFKIHMLAYGAGDFNYLRMTSEEAAKQYGSATQVKTPEFGTTQFRKKLSVIHIDGNHDYENVHKDYHLWRPYRVPGSWLILDDYVWEHGTGPRILGDEIMRDEYKDIDRAFTAGKALFLRFRA